MILQTFLLFSCSFKFLSFLFIFHWCVINQPLHQTFFIGTKSRLATNCLADRSSTATMDLKHISEINYCMKIILNYAKTKAFEFITQFKTLKISVSVSYFVDFSIFFLPLEQNRPTSNCQFLKNLKSLSKWFPSQDHRKLPWMILSCLGQFCDLPRAVLVWNKLGPLTSNLFPYTFNVQSKIKLNDFIF